jgi:carbamoyl-phosphate synthase large subunit
MAKKGILITGIGGDIGQSIIRCIKDIDSPFRLIGCDIDHYASGRPSVDKFLIAPRVAEPKKYLKFLDDNISKYNIKYIYPAVESEIIFFDLHREYFNGKGVIVFINKPFIINTFFDKYETINFLKRNKISHPATFLLEKYNNQLDFPIIIKPRRGCGGRGLIKLDGPEEFKAQKKVLVDAVVQEYLDGENNEYTTGVFSDGEEAHSITFKRKLSPEGFSKMVELVRDEKINKLAEKIARSSNLVGSLNIQSKRNGEDFTVFEINPRFSSTVYFRHYFGFRDVEWWMRLAENKKINFKLKYKRGVGVRCFNENFFNLKK